MEDDEIIELINTNLIAQILLTKRAIKHFIKRKNGRIININSLAGKNGTANESIYCSSKFGLL
jgi:3-oxoacyl-[acyl-carrier protein] reductase